MKRGLTKKFWATLAIFGLMGQVAWVVENMYFNVFIYKMFHASAASISLMVSASAIAATLTTWLMGAFTDRIGKRKILICGGYIVWGISILSFALIRMDVLTPLTGSTAAAAALGVNLVIIMDCVMTFFGSTANDAAFNAWLTDCGDESNRGRIEGINSMMPLVAILVVFGAFMAFDLDRMSSWITIYLIIGAAVILIGVSGFFLIDEHFVRSDETNNYWKNVLYCFRLSTFRENRLLYAVVGAFAIFGISIQIFMPYLILYYEKSLGMDNYVMIMAPAIILAAIFTAFYGKLYDKLSFAMSVVPTVLFLMMGYVFLFLGRTTAPVFVGSLFMMIGYLTGMAIFGAMIRDHIPKDKTGLFQGLRIFGQVFVPGIVGPAIGAAVLSNAQMITNSDGTTSFLPNERIFAAAFVAAVVLLLALYLIFLMIRKGHYHLDTDLEAGDWKEYPRPQLRRDSYYSLNGNWELNGHRITIPFPPQSDLSGYGRRVGAHLTYKKIFQLPEDFTKDRILLHFGAVDQIADVYVNNCLVCHHEGGYLPFTADITEALRLQGTDNELVVKVTDRLSKRYPYGKQCKKRGGMWYTPVSGIWQSVWMESVDQTYIKAVKITPLPEDKVQFEISTNANACRLSIQLEDFIYEADISDKKVIEEKQVTLESKQCIIDMSKIRYPDGSVYEPIHWTPENPHLYSVTIQADADMVTSYFALRIVDIRKLDGHKRICLNGQPIFLHGVLDQGYFSDGIFLPANPSGYEADILRMKELGFNTLRKHIKVEPEEFYYACDRLGMLVMQDMVNNGVYGFIRDTALPTLGQKHRKDTGLLRNRRRKAFFLQHAKDTMEHLYNHPSIVGYTIFNEGWGQFDSDEVGRCLREVDNTRFLDYTSGWFAQKDSDVESLHIYFDTMEIPENKDKPILVSECGGFSHLVPEHYYSCYGSYGYGTCENQEVLTDTIIKMYEDMIIPAIPKGLCGCIYTQLGDVEDEINGFYTYDRRVCKVNRERMLELAEHIYN